MYYEISYLDLYYYFNGIKLCNKIKNKTILHSLNICKFELENLRNRKIYTPNRYTWPLTCIYRRSINFGPICVSVIFHIIPIRTDYLFDVIRQHLQYCGNSIMSRQLSVSQVFYNDIMYGC